MKICSFNSCLLPKAYTCYIKTYGMKIGLTGYTGSYKEVRSGVEKRFTIDPYNLPPRNPADDGSFSSKPPPPTRLADDQNNTNGQQRKVSDNFGDERSMLNFTLGSSVCSAVPFYQVMCYTNLRNLLCLAVPGKSA
ncbi:hypothetical protein ACJJTC_017747 [Scirpophaga incertulas]